MVSISSGVDKESENDIRDRFRVLSLNWFRRGRPSRLINRLWRVGLIQIMLRFDNQTRGISMAVGKIIFNIVRD